MKIVNNNITLVQDIFTKYTRPPKLFMTMKQKLKIEGVTITKTTH